MLNSEALRLRVRERLTGDLVADYQRDRAVCIRQLLDTDDWRCCALASKPTSPFPAGAPR